MEENKKIVSTVFEGEKIDITWSDLWFISFIRKMKYGKLSEVEVQDGRIIMVKKCERKIKPRREV